MDRERNLKRLQNKPPVDDDPDLIELPTPKGKHLSAKEAEEKYFSSSGRIIQEKGDFLLPQVVDAVKAKSWVNLRPEYQRRIRWDDKKKSLFIESLLMNIPIPPIFLFETELNRYEVMDGQQRLASIIDFYADEFELTALQIWPELNRKTYSQLPQFIRRGLDRRRISSVVMLAESSEHIDHSGNDVRLQVFWRLNTGGTPLNAQELRNASFNGPFNDLIVTLSADPTFTKMWDIPSHKAGATTVSQALRDDILFSTMGDCQIVLRFFAFRDQKAIKGSVRRMLDNCMKANRNLPAPEILKLKQEFLSRLRTVRQIFGLDAFELPLKPHTYSRPLFDGLMLAVDSLWESRDQLIKAKSKIRKGFPAFVESPSNYALIVGKPNTADAVRGRIAVIKSYLSKQI